MLIKGQIFFSQQNVFPFFRGSEGPLLAEVK